MDRYAVIGNPIAHSLSPQIHARFAELVGHELEYGRLLAPIDGFGSACRRFFESGGLGLNVTTPFKQDAFAFVNRLDQLAEKARAVNTIVYTKEGLHGFNTDGIGLCADLRRLGWLNEDCRVLILGAGGAAQGILDPLLESGAAITVANRTHSRAEALKKLFRQIEILEFGRVRGGWDLVINATSVGQSGTGLDVPIAVYEDACCYDLFYSKTGRTEFLIKAGERAADISDGLGMLIEQAAEAFRLWRGIRPPTISVLPLLRNDNEEPRPTRRFIAGATCPKCGAIDRVYIDLDKQHVPVAQGCQSCGFFQQSDGTTSLSLEGDPSS